MKLCASFPLTPSIPGLVATTIMLSINVESPHFLTFSVKCCECKIEKREGHGQSRNGHGKVMEKYCVKSVGNLHVKTVMSLNPFFPGLGSRLCESLRDEFSLSYLMSCVVAPHASGESPLQHYNALLCLDSLQRWETHYF